MLDQWLPDIVICTESWLTPEIYDAEIIPNSLGYTMYRRDRGSRGGGVFILVRNLYIANRVQEWETDCEILWIKLQLAGSVPLHIAFFLSFYTATPPREDYVQVECVLKPQCKKCMEKGMNKR